MERAMLGVDGSCGFALLGENIQEGEAEFVEVDNNNENLGSVNERIACGKAFDNLKKRLGRSDLSYWFGLSHPFGD